ncbi:acyl-CoA dehydrogenase domain protein [Xylanimonas cellulosilytica DSM 15894]|uniref:Acyl-CoA dehydrogenase domain protein n=1 Tax=Xylanimonas cellulosilytica (strain DSM 15894 / JCM 12276 / CECT 5975 / KCTC 9989 / LMG 20990 / NBRC 107835 / XIL07) TaxID=446471 RepID=D1BUA7_XYLCX|nr:acyl-CoA dehydrogenase family protein [Xylanimonas cellulosilytica]ACZ31120.1 acyl-CoA dehydrogenase domain protein [Xylanimonas cellulosilytica DSM 15894]
MITETHGLTDEQSKFAELVRDFADQVVSPAAYRFDTEGRLPVEIVHQMGELGLFGLPFPEEVGGQGGDYVTLCLAVEALARVDQSIAVTLEAGVGLGIMPIYRHGTDAQREQWLPDLVAGRTLAAFGLTEAGAGSDAAATRTTARLEPGEGGAWVIDGSKQFITNSGTPITSVVTVVAVTGSATGPDGSAAPELSAILVPAGTPGFVVGPSYDKVGWHASDTHPLMLNGVRVPAANLLGERGRGYANALHVLDEGRIAFAALATGAAQGCLEEALRYAGERTVFGASIGSHQHVAFTLARMQARVHAARTSWFDAAQKLVHGLPSKAEASVAKLVASEAAMANARDATQIFGGYGFMNETPVARHYRDSKVLEIGEGTSEVQLMIIARDLGLTA